MTHQTEHRSISATTSIWDWWNSSPALNTVNDASSFKNSRFREARQRNTTIEYNLFRAILSDRVFIEPPESGKSARTDEGEDSTLSREEEVSDSGKLTRLEPGTPTETSSNASSGIDPPAAERAVIGRFIDTVLEDGSFIHEFCISNCADPLVEATHVVVIHGYMAAMGFFVKNIEEIALSNDHIYVHVLDLPGFGNSSRPVFGPHLLENPSELGDKVDQILQIENWFIDRIEQWRRKRNLRRFKLIGHSMGAYLLSCFLMKYNNQYEKDRLDSGPIVTDFIAVSPMGTESSDESLINSKKLQFNHHAAGNPLKEIFDEENPLENDPTSEELAELWLKLGRPKFPKNTALRKLWEWHISPFWVLQMFGPLYSKLLSYWSFKRFRNLRANPKIDEEVDFTSDDPDIPLILTLHKYSYSIFNQFLGSGELAILKLINQEILPRLPLCDRGFVEFLDATGVKTLWLYGDRDWMNIKGGQYCYDRLKELDQNTGSKLEVVKNAGHHIYLDNPEQFNESCIRFFGLRERV